MILWVLPLDDFAPTARYQQHKMSNPFSNVFTLLTDRESVADVAPAQFCLYYDNSWHPVFIAKFHSGHWTTHVWTEEPGAVALSGHFTLRRMRWHHIALTWDHDAGKYLVYANGVLVAHHDASRSGPKHHEPCGPFLYGGNPALAYSDIEFYDSVLTQEAIREQYSEHAPKENRDLDQELRSTYEGADLPTLTFQHDDSWRPALEVPFSSQDDLLKFHHQGAINGLSLWPEGGLRISTPPLAASLAKTDFSSTDIGTHAPDWNRMYLWSRRSFEGDLYFRMEFKILSHGGLSLICFQAAGMQGEDFLADYYLRSDGSMRMVCWEDVRNYHWEYYREMVDVRNDAASHAALKNPWYKPLSFQVEDRRWELDRWYVLEYLQEGGTLRGLIDGRLVMDALDNPLDNNGPVLLNGHIGIRFMMQTDMVIRNITIRDRPHVDHVHLT